MQAVEQLPLVLVDPLHLHVEHGVGVDLHLVVLLQVHSELHLVFLLYQNRGFVTEKSSTSARAVICMRCIKTEFWQDSYIRYNRKTQQR